MTPRKLGAVVEAGPRSVTPAAAVARRWLPADPGAGRPHSRTATALRQQQRVDKGA